ncbi:MAG: glycosyltransferase family 39 protein [Cyanobacteria bacterium J06635_10]
MSEVPGGFNCDEALNGYEAYSILETSRDRYGKLLPLFTRAFNSYRPTLYIFAAIPSVKIFGLNEFGVRFPSAFFGVLTVWMVFLIVKHIFSPKWALISAFMLAINPWHIHFSRSAYEASLLPFLFCLGYWLFLKSFKKPTYLIFSAIIFSMSLNTYHAARVFVPLFLMGLIIIYKKHIIDNFKQSIAAFIAFNTIFIPIFRFWISPQGMARASQVGIETSLSKIIINYISFFNPKYLFWDGFEDLSLNPVGIGCFYYFEFVTIGLCALFLAKRGNKNQKTLLFWLFLYPIPAALVDTVNPLRTLAGAPIFAILSGCGVAIIKNYLEAILNRSAFKLACIFLVSFMMSGFTYFFTHYYTNYPPEALFSWKYGLREAIQYAENHSYSCVIMSSDRNSNCYAIHDFISHVPFYTQYPPEKYQRSPISPLVGDSQANIYSLGKYSLASIENQTKLNERCLYIVRPDELITLDSKGYAWKEVYAIEDNRNITYFKLVEIYDLS